MTDKEKTIKELKEALDSLDITNKYRLNLIRAIEYLQEEPVSGDLEEALAREWQGYNDRGAATVDALEDNTQELAFAKGFYRGAKWQKQRLISKAIEYLKRTYEDIGIRWMRGYEADDLVEAFKKELEEE